MADNVTITAGVGTTIAADEIAGVKYQRVKLVLGADGAADLDVDSGQQVMANSVPVVVASDQWRAPVYLGSPERLTLDGSAHSATLPTGTNRIRLAAEGGDLRYAINATATSTSPGYLPAGSVEYIRSSNITSFSVYGPNGAYADLIYYQE